MCEAKKNPAEQRWKDDFAVQKKWRGASDADAEAYANREGAKNAAAVQQRKAREASAALPPPAPDFTDDTLRMAKRAQALRLTAGRGRASTFLTGPGAGQ